METECFRFNVPASAEDIDLGAGVRSCSRLHCTLMELGCWDDAGSFRASTAAACSMMITIMLDIEEFKSSVRQINSPAESINLILSECITHAESLFW